MILLLKDNNLKECGITTTLEKIKNELEKITSLNKLIEIEKNINELNLNIFNETLNEKYVTVIDLIYEKPELISFLKDKKMDDIHQMGEFIDDSEDVFITILDINYLESCKKFLEDLYKFNSNAKELFDNFIKLVDNNNDIGMKFENSSSKYHDFHELYIKFFNKSEITKQQISTIYTSSTLNLIPFYPSYK